MTGISHIGSEKPVNSFFLESLQVVNREGGFARGDDVRERGIRAAGDELHQVGKNSGLGEFFLGGIGEEEVHLAPFFQEEGGLGTDFRGIQAIDGARRAADRDELLLDDGILRIPDAVLICGLR